jgi:hypothetical protein
MDKDQLAALDRAHKGNPTITNWDNLCEALVNTYRTGQLVLIDDGAVERVAGGISTCPPMSDKHPMESLPLARAALAALGVK